MDTDKNHTLLIPSAFIRVHPRFFRRVVRSQELRLSLFRRAHFTSPHARIFRWQKHAGSYCPARI